MHIVNRVPTGAQTVCKNNLIEYDKRHAESGGYVRLPLLFRIILDVTGEKTNNH